MSVSIKNPAVVLLLDAVRSAAAAYRTYKIQKLSAALAFYGIISLGPMLVVALYVAGWFWGSEAAEGTLVDGLRGMVGEQAGVQLQRILRNTAVDAVSSAAAAVGLVTLLIAATTFFSDMHSSLNLLWDLQVDPGKRVRNLLLTRLLAFLLVLGLGVLLLSSLMLDSLLGMVIRGLREVLPGSAYLAVRLVNAAAAFGISVVLFAVIFRFLPDAVPSWRPVRIGAVFTAVLFTIGKTLILAYLRRSSIDTMHGVAGSLVLLLLWIYFSAMILYFGAAFTKAVIVRYDGAIQHNKVAVGDRPDTVG